MYAIFRMYEIPRFLRKIEYVCIKIKNIVLGVCPLNQEYVSLKFPDTPISR